MKTFLRKLFTLGMLVFIVLAAYSAYATYSLAANALSVTAKVIKTDRTDHLGMDTPTEIDIGKPYAGSIREYSTYKSLISYLDPQTNTEKTAYLPTERQYNSDERIAVLIPKTGGSAMVDSFWSIWGVAISLFLVAALCGALLECF